MQGWLPMRRERRRSAHAGSVRSQLPLPPLRQSGGLLMLGGIGVALVLCLVFLLWLSL